MVPSVKHRGQVFPARPRVIIPGEEAVSGVTGGDVTGDTGEPGSEGDWTGGSVELEAAGEEVGLILEEFGSVEDVVVVLEDKSTVVGEGMGLTCDKLGPGITTSVLVVPAGAAAA